MSLNPRQEKFCLEYVMDGNATQAAIRAGYSAQTAGKTAHRNLKKPHIRARVDDLMTEIKSCKIADATEVQEFLTACLRGEAVEEIIVAESIKDGGSKTKVFRKRMAGRERVKAAELLGRMHGMFTERLVVSEEPPVIVLGKGEDSTDG